MGYHQGARDKDGVAKYEKIAVDIAYSITHGEWAEGTLVKGRSTLSGKYSVSPETIRRAVKLLEDSSVVEVLDKRGLLIKSVAAAERFIQEHQAEDRIMSLRDDIKSLFAQKKTIEEKLESTLDDLIEQAMSLRNVGLIFPFEVSISVGSPLVGKSIGEVQFWASTGATIIGVKRGGHLQLSPGPKLVFFEGDVILYVANEHLQSMRIEQYVNPPKIEPEPAEDVPTSTEEVALVETKSLPEEKVVSAEPAKTEKVTVGIKETESKSSEILQKKKIRL